MACAFVKQQQSAPRRANSHGAVLRIRNSCIHRHRLWGGCEPGEADITDYSRTPPATVAPTGKGRWFGFVTPGKCCGGGPDVCSDFGPQCQSASGAPVRVDVEITPGRAAFEKHIEFVGFSHPRLGMRTATWDELGDLGRSQWEAVAQNAIDWHSRRNHLSRHTPSAELDYEALGRVAFNAEYASRFEWEQITAGQREQWIAVARAVAEKMK